MASYKAGFDPPHRTAPVDSRSRRLATYIPPETTKPEPRGPELASRSGQAQQPKSNLQPPAGRPLPTGLPRPSMRSPSPGPRALTEPKITGAGTRFGFGKPPTQAPPATRQPVRELRGKSSRNVLRRKPSTIAQHSGASRSTPERSGSASPSKWSQASAENRPSIEASLKSVEAYNEIFTTMATAKLPTSTESPRIIPELDRYRTKPEDVATGKAELPHKLSTTDLPPPTPMLSGTPLYSGSGSSYHRYSGYSGSGYSASPSTRYSESPGPGAPYSRDTTPTSMSSQSSGIVAPLKPLTPRLRQGSPAHTRPPVTRRRAGSNANETEGAVDPQGLPSLRESLTSSSSNSTVKGEKKAEETPEKKKKKRLSPMPPSPPPRKSSQKFKKDHSDVEESPSKPSQAPAKPVMEPATKPLVSSKKPTASQPQNKSVPPVRPSREGAPDLQSDLSESIAVIQSNLTGLSFPPDRRQSGIQRSAPSPLLIPRSAQGSRLPSRNPSPSPIQPSPRTGTPAPAGLGIIPDLRPQQASAPVKGSGLRTPSPSTAIPKPRFGLFGRRAKTAPEIPTLDTTRERPTRKGPAAGTGHEGYGRYGLRGRSSSAGVPGRGRERSMSAASSSQESISSTRTHDPFLLERMSPVIIAGGEVIENRNTSSELTRSESNTSLLLGRPSIESAKGSSKSSLSHEVSRNTLWPSALPREPAKRSSTLAAPKGRRPSDSSDDGVGKGSIAFRRSIQRLNNSTSALHLPKALNLSSVSVGASMTSLDASIPSEKAKPEIVEAGRGRKVEIVKSKKLEKRPKSPRKWNIFHRSAPKPHAEPEAPVSVTLGRPPVKPIPHYALLDSSDEMPEYMEGMELEDILRDAEVVDLSNEELDRLQFGEMTEKLKKEREEKMKAAKAEEERLPPILFSSPEPLQPAQGAGPAELHLSNEEAPVRPSRLPQVGRIPKVVSARPQATSPKSFSRPFARLSITQPLASPVVVDKDSVALGASPPKPSTIERPHAKPQPETDRELSLRKDSADSRTGTTDPPDFLAFSPRKGSEATSSSSGGMSFAGTTAVIPEPGAALAEDEVWDEYDDLIENDDTVKVPLSATSSHGVPFQYEGYESRRMRKNKAQAKESPLLASTPQIQEPAERSEPTRRSILTSSSVYSADMSANVKDSLAAVPTPTTPMSFTDFFSGYGDRNNSVAGDSAKKPQRRSQSSSRKSASPSTHSRSLSGLVTITEQENVTPISQVNLRVGSMTVSKWLTFGHVLFSPARESIGPSKRHSILVVDGLGNDDWSFYAAETYPSATFYNLSPTKPLPPSSRLSSATAFPLTPPNHRQIEHPSPTHKFPFPSSNFHVVVFRFPPSLPLSTYQHIVSEAKRVLLPGGYLEMAILDLDMMNMGPRARRAVRGLKMGMQRGESGVWTGSASDTVLKFVGKRGFDSVKSCFVGVPVATPILASQQQPSSSAQQEEKSLADMMKDTSKESDDGITKMVAKVGRWWYTRCHEGGVADVDGAGSIFDNEELVREAEEWNSSFKLLVAHARKPVVARRRTLSA